MTTSFSPLNIRRSLNHSYLGRRFWSVPTEFGPDGWCLQSGDRQRSIIVSCADADGAEWFHASVAGAGELPAYAELKWLHKAVFGDGYAYQVFAPPSCHVNIHEYALHLWGRADGKPALPEFGLGGTI